MVWGTLVLVGLCLPARLKARDDPYTTFDLIAIAAYDSTTQDLGVCGNLVCNVALMGFRWQCLNLAPVGYFLSFLMICKMCSKSVWIPKAQLVLAFYFTLVSIDLVGDTLFVAQQIQQER